MSELLLTVQASRIKTREFRPGKLYIYNDKLVFENRGLFSRKESTINYPQISQVNLKKGLLRSTIEIINTGGAANIALEHIAKETAEKAKELIDLKVKEIHEPRKEPIHSSDDPLERIKKLSVLKDQGVISQEEFDKKKADLLSQV